MKNLVVVRCGDGSLHPEWILDDLNFDIILSYFGKDINYDLSKIKYVHYFKGSKWEGLYDFFLNYPEIWNSYDYIWLPDDDLSMTSQTINSFFDLVYQYEFSLSQPALTHNSYYSHEILLQIKGVSYRETNFVEVMAPCFSKNSLIKCWKTFSENKSGWGLDSYWPKILENKKIGVIDKVPIFHTRPVGIAGHGTVARNQISPKQEYITLCRKYGLQMRQGCYGVFTQENKYITKKQDILNVLVGGCSPVRLQEKKSFNRLYDEAMWPDKVL